MIKMVGRNIIQFHSRMWNLARSWKPVVLLPLLCVTWHPAHAHKRDRWGVMASFFLLILEETNKNEKMSLHKRSGACFGCCIPIEEPQRKGRILSQAWNVSRLAQLRVVAGWVWVCVENKLFVRRWHGIASVSVGKNVQKWMEEGQNGNGKICWYSHPEDRKVYLIALDSLHENEMPKEH